VLGPVFWGWMADRIGRRSAFIAAVLDASLASGIMAVTPDQGGLIFLTTFFFFAAFGSSGLIITILPLVQEFVPASKRGWVRGMVIALIASLAFAPALGTRLAVNISLAVHISWRALFALGLLPALLTLLIRAWVPESPRWLVRNRLIEDARRSLAWALRVAPDRIDLPALLPKMQHMPWHALFKHRRSVMVTCAISLIQIGGAGVALSTGVFFLDPQDWRGLGGLPDARTDLGRLGWAICYVVSVGCDRTPWLWYAMRFQRSDRLCARRILL
jgi:putative MFS transporter